MAIQDNTDQDVSSGAVVIAFPKPRQRGVGSIARRLTLHDRVEAIHWADAMRRHGVSRAVPHAGGDLQIAGFILIYLTGERWASWVTGCMPTGYCVWRAGSDTDFGCFPTLGEALAAVERLL